MAESRPSVNYQISSGVLASMKSAAGNYLPNYGNWRFRVDPSKPEEPEEEPDPVETVDEEKEKLTGSDSDSWGEEGTEGKVGEVLTESEEYKNEAKMSDAAWKEFLANETIEEKKARRGREVERGVRAESTGGTDDTRGGVNRSYDIVGGEKINIQEEYYGADAPEDHVSAFKKRSPYKMHEGEPHPNTSVRPGSFADPYSGIDEMLATSVSDYSGASKAMHGHIENIVRGFKPDSNAGDKRAQADARINLATLADNVARDVGPDSAVKNLHDIVNENLLSASTRPEEKYVISKLLDYLDVVPGITEDNSLIHRVPMPDGGMLPVDSKYMEDLAKKRVIQYSLGAEFDKAKGDFLASGEAGNQWSHIMEDSIHKKNSFIFSKDPDAFASLLLDEDIFFSGSLADRMKEKYSPDADVDMKELVYEASQDKELYNELVEDAAWALTMTAKESVDMGYSTYLKNNGGDTALDAQSLLDKYA